VPLGIADCPVIPWRGTVWRTHHYQYVGDSTSGSRCVSGRYNRGLDLYDTGDTWETLYASGDVWEALYVGLSWGVCLAELVRHLTPATLPAAQQSRRCSEIELDLQCVLDCTDLALLGVKEEELLHNSDYSIGQALARAARGQACEALLVPSACRMPGPEGWVMAVFPDLLRAGSVMRVIQTIAPNLGPVSA
jgi:hypothetical protein